MVPSLVIRISSMEEILFFEIAGNFIRTPHGDYWLTSYFPTQLTALLTTKALKLEKYYQLQHSAKNIVAPLSCTIPLMNGLLIEGILVGDETVRITISYIPEENLLHKYPIEHIGSLHPIVDENNEYVLNFFQRDTGSVLKITIPSFFVDKEVHLGRGEGSIPGPIGTVLIFAQKKVVYILKKLGPDQVKLLIFTNDFSTEDMPRSRKKVNRKPITNLPNSTFKEVSLTQISGLLVFIGALMALVKFIRRKLAARKKRIHKGRLQGQIRSKNRRTSLL